MSNAVKNGNNMDYNFKKFICDTMAEMNAISTSAIAAGSTALVLATKELYVLSNAKVWTLLTKYGSGGGGEGSLTADDVASVADTNGYLNI